MTDVTLDALSQIDIYKAVHTKFEKALADGDLVYTPSQKEQVVEEASSKLKFQLTIVPGLGKRPQNRPVEPDSEDASVSAATAAEFKDKSPFNHPEPELLVVDNILGKYMLLLNKFPNTEDHFLLVTKKFVSQDTLLQPEELSLMHVILEKLNSSPEVEAQHTRFFAFFNSGPESGYSQFHKHMQFMKLPANFPVYQTQLVSNVDFFFPNEFNVNKHPIINKKASYKHNILKIKPEFADAGEREDTLAMLYMFLVRRVLNVFKEREIDRARVSYNFLMMEDWMMAVPRRHAKYENVWQNSLGYMGLFNAKDEQVWHSMETLGFSKILEECGFPIEENEQVISYNEYSY